MTGTGRSCQMVGGTRSPLVRSIRRWALALLAGAGALSPQIADAQGLTGALIGTVKDQQGAVLSFANSLFCS